MMTTEHEHPGQHRPARVDELGQGMQEPNWATTGANPPLPERRAPLALSDGTTLEDIISSTRDGLTAEQADRMRREVEAAILAPAHAVMIDRPEQLDVLVDHIAGPTFERAQRCQIAVESLANIVLRAVPARRGDLLLGMPSPQDAPRSFAEAVTAVGMLLSGVLDRDDSLVAKADAARADDVEVARDMILVLSIYLAYRWKTQILVQHQALGAYAAVVEMIEEPEV